MLEDENTNEPQNPQLNIGAISSSAWIDSNDELPTEDENVEISDDGIDTLGTANYKRNRQCMLAGVGGGNGYFGSLGWATDGSVCDNNLILDTPPFWRGF